MRTALLRLIRLYQSFISPSLGVACRYEPTCSRYAYEAVESHGAARGTRLALGRLWRCRPGGGSGYDPVPDTDDRATDRATGDTSDPNTSTSTTISTTRFDSQDHPTTQPDTSLP